jgi:hypothetical protein
MKKTTLVLTLGLLASCAEEAGSQAPRQDASTSPMRGSGASIEAPSLPYVVPPEPTADTLLSPPTPEPTADTLLSPPTPDPTPTPEPTADTLPSPPTVEPSADARPSECAANEAGYQPCNDLGVPTAPCCMCVYGRLTPQPTLCASHATTSAQAWRLSPPCTSWDQFSLCRQCPTTSNPDTGRMCAK